MILFVPVGSYLWNIWITLVILWVFVFVWWLRVLRAYRKAYREYEKTCRKDQQTQSESMKRLGKVHQRYQLTLKFLKRLGLIQGYTDFEGRPRKFVIDRDKWLVRKAGR